MKNLLAAAVILELARMTVHPFPLDSMYARGDSCLNIVWTPDSRNTIPDWYVKNGSYCTGSDSIYLHCDFVAGITCRSIAYSYGGEDPYYLFRKKLGDGLLAGSHLCHYQTVGDPSPYVAGTDCSGFVCYVWNVPRTSTGCLLSDPHYLKISKSECAAGDILVKAGSHAAFIVEKEDSTRFLIWESTSAVNGCRERAIDIYDAACAAYVPLRNPDNLHAADPAGKNTGVRTRTLLRAAAARNGNLLDLLFARPFTGEITLYDIRGGRLDRMSAATASGRLSWILPSPLSGGTYVIVMEPVCGAAESARCMVVE